MNDDSRLDDLERFLVSAPILSLSTNGAHGAHMSYLAVLESGVGVLLKPEDAIADGPVMVRREVAAWVLARELGWPDLVSATVLRPVTSPTTGAEIAASVQVLWPNNQPAVPVDAFPEEDLWRAAIFDALVQQSDRHPNNWLGVPRDGDGIRLKLIDHGFAFDQNRGFQSPFTERYRGAEIPDPHRAAIRRFRSPRQGAAWEELLRHDEWEGVERRAEQLDADGSLSI